MFTSLDTGAIGFSVPFEEALQLAQASSFEGLDLPIKQLLTRVQQTSVQEIKDRFQQALEHIGYDCPVVVEPFNAEHLALPPAERVQATHTSLAKIWQQAGLH